MFELKSLIQTVLAIPVLLVHNYIVYPLCEKKFLKKNHENTMEDYISHHLPETASESEINSFVVRTAYELF